MINRIVFELIQNIQNKINLLKQDAIIATPDLNPILVLIIGILFSLCFFYCTFIIGNFIRQMFLSSSETKDLNLFIDICLGYLFIGTSIAILGFLSLLNIYLIWAYIACVILFTLGITIKHRNEFIIYKKNINIYIKKITENRFIFIWTIVFISIALINLINPEIREDQYHVDFPKIYLNQQTTMIPPMEQLHVSAAPLLSEMTYLLGILIWSNESARYIHFLFYILIILALFSIGLNKKYKFSIYTPLLFASAPVVIHETSSVYVDFQWMLMYLLSLYLISTLNKFNYKNVVLVGLLIGGMVSIKLWTIVLIPLLAVFLLWRLRPININFIKKSLILIMSVLLFPSIWFIRSYILTGNPFYPAFSSIVNLENTKEYYGILHYIGLNTSLINPKSLINVFSPLFFLGIGLILFKFNKNRLVLKSYLFKIVIGVLILYLVIQYPFGRYLFGLYILLIFISSLGIYNFVNHFKYSKIVLSMLLFVLSAYYLINSLLVLPYTFNLADKNKYLTRILSKDNSSYYDFDNKFDKYIKQDDYIATYKIFGYYYAKFNFLDVNFVFNKNERDFKLLKNKGFNYLFTKDFTIEQMCNNLKIQNCNPSSYSLTSQYNKYPNYYLYKLK